MEKFVEIEVVESQYVPKANDDYDCEYVYHLVPGILRIDSIIMLHKKEPDDENMKKLNKPLCHVTYASSGHMMQQNVSCDYDDLVKKVRFYHAHVKQDGSF